MSDDDTPDPWADIEPAGPGDLARIDAVLDGMLDAAIEHVLHRAARRADALRGRGCREGHEQAELVIRAAIDQTDRMRADW